MDLRKFPGFRLPKIDFSSVGNVVNQDGTVLDAASTFSCLYSTDEVFNICVASGFLEQAPSARTLPKAHHS